MKFRLVFFDYDGVLTNDNLQGCLHKAIGLPKSLDNKWYSEYYEGKISSLRWLNNLETLYRQHNLTRVFFKMAIAKLTTNPEAEELLDYLHKQKIPSAIVSSGINLYVKRQTKLPGITPWQANYSMIFDKNGDFVRTEYLGEEPEAKAVQIKEICKILGIKPTKAMFVGGAVNDFKTFRLTGHGILYRPKQKRV